MNMTPDDYIIDVDETTFLPDVLERSRRQPVIVDFWAPWCGPCRMLSPTLERITTEANGAFTLARLNTDENQGLAAEYGVQGIPAVKMFRDGKVVGEFVGALPEPRVREFIKKYAPNQSDLILTAAQDLARAHRWAEAETAYRHALAGDPNNAQIALELSKVLLRLGTGAEAAALLEAIPAEAREADAARKLLPAARWMCAVPAAEAQEIDRLYATAGQLACTGKYAEAMDSLIGVLRQNRSYRSGEARQVMLGLFELLGTDDPIVREHQRQLANVLF
ncbi:MAG TPA: thioredoxin [Burkholderiales bacterium]|nr:thioredoxin [Burkholderiales bacterium]